VSDTTGQERKTHFQKLLVEVAGKLEGRVEILSTGDAVIHASPTTGRKQRVFLQLDEDTIRYSTQCSSWSSELLSPNLFKTLLRKNYHLKHGYFALNPEGGLELVDTQFLSTADPEELYVSIVNLATVGDFMERELSRSRDDVF
jgi:hypothetical protein